ncbi:MAG: tRNA 2-thiouridine(34) synthase MnmA [bacterium]
MRKRVVVAMSGGVDSSTAALLLKEEGYEVIGITMQIWPSDRIATEADKLGGCCSLGAVEDARRVARKLDIPYYVMNFRKVFAEKVIANFCEEYQRGRTPNPCIRCNQYLKFTALLERAKKLDACFIATGHYARIEFDPARRRYLLKKGVDSKKDQSYVLYTMTQFQLKHTLMPLGNLTKERVRRMAREGTLPVAEKSESQEICFIPDDDYGEFLRESLPKATKPGPILDREGKVLGKHQGILFYTIGQRKGLGMATGEPLYVVSICRKKNAIVVGKDSDVYADELVATRINYVDREKLTEPAKLKAKIRYSAREAEATVTPSDKDGAWVKFKKPQRAITPGQAVVFYDRDILVGGGTIVKSVRRN